VKTPKFWQEMPDKQKKETISTIIIITVVIGGTFGVMGLTKVALQTDYPLVVVISESMLPGIEVGDLLVVKGMDPEDIIVGDHDAQNGSIIIYETEGIWLEPIPDPVVHRVVNRTYNVSEGRYYFITHGDDNSHPDSVPIPEENVLGVVIYQIPKIGLVKMFLDESGLTWVLIAILSVLLVVSIIQDIRNPEDEEEDEKIKSKSKDNGKIPDSSGSDPPDSEKYDLGS